MYKAILRGTKMLPTPGLIKSPADVMRIVSPVLCGEDREHFVVLYMNTRGRLLQLETVSIGTLNLTIVHPREVFKPAICLSAASIILVHNHPSGDPRPSADDKDITERMQAVGDLVGIAVLDHIIVAEDGYYSFGEHGK